LQPGLLIQSLLVAAVQTKPTALTLSLEVLSVQVVVRVKESQTPEMPVVRVVVPVKTVMALLGVLELLGKDMLVAVLLAHLSIKAVVVGELAA
jgi:hypothetical protein